MARPTHVPHQEEASPAASPAASTAMYFLAVPELTYKALSDAAAKRNLSIAQFLSVAIADLLKQPQGA